MKLRVAAFVAFISLLSCINENAADISIENISFQPEFAFPIGSQPVAFSNYSSSTDLKPINDTLLNDFDAISDTIFNYNDRYYYLPENISTDNSIPFSFDQNKEDLDLIKSFLVKTNVTSGIPGKVVVQVYFMNQGTTLDSLYDNPFQISGPELDDSGNITSTIFSTNKTTYENPDRIFNILDTDELKITTSLTIPSYKEVNTKYNDSLKLEIQVAARIKLNLTPFKKDE
ncbi:MAG: hypothetical protein JEZ09_09345 [Salinivirgaceae bacterium]|nr:hypothetical protein [Salinivirgaceae bacterium]